MLGLAAKIGGLLVVLKVINIVAKPYIFFKSDIDIINEIYFKD